MKSKNFVVLLAIFVIFSACGKDKGEDIISRQYQNEKSIQKTFNAKFDIRLENVGYSKKTAKLIETLIYQGKNFDEYIAHTEEQFIATIDDSDFPPMTGEDGKEYYHQSYFNESYHILHYNSSFIIIEYNKYYVLSSAAHGNLWTEYFIIDIAEGRILSIDDIATPLSEDFLKDVIQDNYKINVFLRDKLWSPDTININRDSVELVWNIYTITPYSDGIIGIVLQDDSFLTKKGKAIKAKLK
jgi:hypothetical protein